MSEVFSIGDTKLNLRTDGDRLLSIGVPVISGVPMRDDSVRWLPWFDTGAGDVFREFRLRQITHHGARTTIQMRAVSDPDAVFQQRRDSSGDLCFRQTHWDADPLEADFRMVIEPAERIIETRRFTGFRYHFEFESPTIKIHRLVDRQTWELGGALDDTGVNVVCRNLFDLPRKRLTRESTYSTSGLDHPAGLMPGSQWARWTLLPPFDMQYSARGTMLAFFDHVSLIRSAIESTRNESHVRYLDVHHFELSDRVVTNAKTVLFCPDTVDDTDALNLWTTVQDIEHQKAALQFNLPAEPAPALAMSIGETRWTNYNFDTSYDDLVDLAAEFHCDFVGTDAVWENGEALRMFLAKNLPVDKQAGTIREKFRDENMCCTLDFKVADEFGGEAGLKRLCDRAKARDLGVVIWLGLHYTPYSTYIAGGDKLGEGHGGVFATKESGRHPDTGYASSCWPINLNAPVFDYVRSQILGACQRTGVSGIRWDSFSNLGWWQIDYGKGDMRPQFDRMAGFFNDLVSSGVRVWAEGLCGFSNQSCVGLHGGNVYEGDLLGYSYNSAIPLGRFPGEGGDLMLDVLVGGQPIDLLFQCFAHRRVPPFFFHVIPRDKWNPSAVEEIKRAILAYRACRENMTHRTILKDGMGVRWDSPGHSIIWNFIDRPADDNQIWSEVISHERAKTFYANRVYRTEANHV